MRNNRWVVFVPRPSIKICTHLMDMHWRRSMCLPVKVHLIGKWRSPMKCWRSTLNHQLCQNMWWKLCTSMATTLSILGIWSYTVTSWHLGARSSLTIRGNSMHIMFAFLSWNLGCDQFVNLGSLLVWSDQPWPRQSLVGGLPWWDNWWNLCCWAILVFLMLESPCDYRTPAKCSFLRCMGSSAIPQLWLKSGVPWAAMQMCHVSNAST